MKVIATWILASLCVAGVLGAYDLELSSGCSEACSPANLTIPPHDNMTTDNCWAYRTFFRCARAAEACKDDNITAVNNVFRPAVSKPCSVLLHPILCEESCPTTDLANYTSDFPLSDADCIAYGEFHKCLADTYKCRQDFVMPDRKIQKPMITEHCGLRSLDITTECSAECSTDHLAYPPHEDLTKAECLAYKKFIGCVKEKDACANDTLVTKFWPGVHDICLVLLHPDLCEEACPTANLKDHSADVKLNKDECTAYASFHKCLDDTIYCQDDFVMKGRKEKKAKITEQCESGATAPGVAMVTVLVSALVALRLVK